MRAGRRSARLSRVVTLGLGILSGSVATARPATYSLEELKGLSIEELGQLEVTSVSKHSEPLGEAAAAIFVITSEDIRRSGAVSLPEVLRLAPNLEVARLSASGYSISARGFNSTQAANKLLVMIDGRSIYTPLHGGVFWDQDQVLLEDIDRIEIISGPGGTLWGANAVNGVINIITKRAAETQGGLLTGYVGNLDHGVAARYGGKIGANGAFRVYGQAFKRGSTLTSGGSDARDDFKGRQAGFRYDWTGEADTLTFQGDVFRNPFDFGGRNSGGNFLARWNRRLGERSNIGFQAYYDLVNRKAPGVKDHLETVDVQAQHSFVAGARHRFVWGAGYRHTWDEFLSPGALFVVVPESRPVSIGNLFIQDEIGLTEDLTLTLGTKLEYSSYSGLEYLPNARLGWRVNANHFLWASISRAVRTPSRIDRDLFAAGLVDRATNLDSEKVLAYELGYRGTLSTRWSASVNLFYNRYEDLRVLTLKSNGRFAFGNALEGHTYGLESWAGYRIQGWWRLRPGLSLLKKNLNGKGNALSAARYQHVGNDPEYQFSLRSMMDLPGGLEFDVGLRAVDDLPNPRIPDYLAVDARLGWAVTRSLELWVAGFNFFDPHHVETGDPGALRLIRRSVYAGARWRF